MQNDFVPKSIVQLNNMDDRNVNKAGFQEALAKECQSFRNTGTYDTNEIIDLTLIPSHLIGTCKPIFSKKFNADGTFDKYKCRIVFRGDRWIDHYHNKTYAGTVKSESIRLLLAICRCSRHGN